MDQTNNQNDFNNQAFIVTSQRSIIEFLSDLFNYDGYTYYRLQKEETETMSGFAVVVFHLAFLNFAVAEKGYFKKLIWHLMAYNTLFIIIAIILLIQFIKLQVKKSIKKQKKLEQNNI